MRDALSGDPAVHYVVIEAESGLRALRLRRTLKPNCLIIDHDLPDLSALEALKKLAAEEGAPPPRGAPPPHARSAPTTSQPMSSCACSKRRSSRVMNRSCL